MQEEFECVLPGIGVRCRSEKRDALVNKPALAVDQFRE
jgi:hypothetical protein